MLSLTANKIDARMSRRFLIGDDAADNAFGRWLEADMRAAQLSLAFRIYYQLRSLVPLPVRQVLQRYRPVNTDPRWCFPDSFARALVEQVRASVDGVTTIHPWPDGATFAFVPTHDVETADGMKNIAKIANLEQALGFRSSWNIVPHKYPVDRGLLRDLQSRGFEIGVHGYNHDGKLFTSRAAFNRRVPAINAALQSFGAVGFRAPMVHRNLTWMQSLNIEYDASCFDADPFQAMPGGVGGMWPFIAGRFVELPYTLPQDHTLFIALNERDGRIWEDKLEFIVRHGGMALLITHPDYLDSDDRIDAYRRLLEKSRETPGMWHALPREVAAWWRKRDESTLEFDSLDCRSIRGPASGRARIATLRLAGTPVRPSDCSAANRAGKLAPAVGLSWHELPRARRTPQPAHASTD
jgi:peptidoglycan/xylan/chitin deacetylase (PgdA/CDA1 family)